MSASQIASSVYHFGEFRLNPAKRELWRNKERIRLNPKAFDCLVYLIEHRERSIGRDELIAAVWGKAELAADILSHMVSLARRAIGDSSEEQRTIRTLPHIGYMWVAPVEVCDADSPSTLPEAIGKASAADTNVDVALPIYSSAASVPPYRNRFKLYGVLGLAIFVLACVGLWEVTRTQHTDDASSPTRSKGDIALVLPVAVKADEGNVWARLGIMDLIADRLRVAGQPVVPSDSAVALTHGLDMTHLSPPDVDQLAKAANAALVLDARAEYAQDGWHVSLRTIYGRNPPLVVEGASSDLLDAARAAADDMARALGWTPAASDNLPPRERAFARRVQQIKAAILGNRMDEARMLLDGADADEKKQPEFRYQQAYVEMTAGQYEGARDGFEALIRDASLADDPILHARALLSLGITYRRHLDYDAAERQFDAAVEILDRDPTPQARALLGPVLVGRGNVHVHKNELDAAQTDFAHARVALESTGARVNLEALDNSLGNLYAQQAHFAEALPLLTRAATSAAALHDLNNELIARSNIACDQLELLNPGAALAEDTRIRDLLRQTADPVYRWVATLTRVRVLDANGSLKAADDLLRELREGAAAAGADQTLLAWAEALAARQASFANNFEQAARDAQASLNVNWESADRREYARTWLTLLHAQIALGQTEAAAKTAAAADDWAKRNQNPIARIEAALARAEYSTSIGKIQDAKAAFEQAQAGTDAERVPADLLQVSELYTAYLIQHHELAEASVVADKLASWASQDYGVALLQLRFYHSVDQPAAVRAALQRANALAGERIIPPELLTEPTLHP